MVPSPRRISTNCQRGSYIPVGTARSTSWAVYTFLQWIKQRNEHLPQEVYPVDILQKPYATDVVCNCLQRFVSEAKRMDGTPYPPKTLYQILCRLLWYTRECQPNPPNFLDRKDVWFKRLHGIYDTIFHGLHESSVGVMDRWSNVLINDWYACLHVLSKQLAVWNAQYFCWAIT